MSKHTPGPWIVYAYEKPELFDGAKMDCCIYSGADVAAYCHTRDARLIAAAPKMFKALKQIAGALEDWASIPPPRDNTGEERVLVVAAALARSVVTMAEGEEA